MQGLKDTLNDDNHRIVTGAPKRPIKSTQVAGVVML